LGGCFRIAQWFGVQTSNHTRVASEADIPRREPKTRTMRGSPGLTTSTRRPTQMPSILSRCMSSLSVSMRQTMAHVRGGSSLSRVSGGVMSTFASITAEIWSVSVWISNPFLTFNG
jgi:hypothetical protein